MLAFTCILKYQLATVWTFDVSIRIWGIWVGSSIFPRDGTQNTEYVKNDAWNNKHYVAGNNHDQP